MRLETIKLTSTGGKKLLDITLHNDFLDQKHKQQKTSRTPSNLKASTQLKETTK